MTIIIIYFTMYCGEGLTWSAASSSSAIVLLFGCCVGAAGLRGFLPGGGAAAGCLLVSLDESACVTEGAACSMHTQNERPITKELGQSSAHTGYQHCYLDQCELKSQREHMPLWPPLLLLHRHHPELCQTWQQQSCPPASSCGHHPAPAHTARQRCLLKHQSGQGR